MNRSSWLPSAVGVLLLVLLAVSAQAEPRLVVYCGRGEALVAPVFEAFEQRTGIEVDVRYNKTPALATQLLSEGAQSPADLVFLQESGYLGALAERDLLAPLPDSLLSRVDPLFRDPDGRWLGTSGRARVLVYSPSRVDSTELPSSLADLALPMWKGRLGWAPGNASYQAHVSALRHLWGEKKTREWLEAVMANEPRVYPKNSPIVRAVAAGEIDLGWVNHYYLHRLAKPGFDAANHSLTAPADAGNVLMVAGVAVRRGSPRTAEAHRLIAFLVSEVGQRHFAIEGFEYPTRPGVATHPDVPPLESLHLAAVDQAHLTDVAPTLELLRSLGLQ